jgi:hypothetical protein
MSTDFHYQQEQLGHQYDPLHVFEPHQSHHNKQVRGQNSLQRRPQQRMQQQPVDKSFTKAVNAIRQVDSSWDAAWQEEEEHHRQTPPTLSRWSHAYEGGHASLHKDIAQQHVWQQTAPQYVFRHDDDGDDMLGGAYERMLSRLDGNEEKHGRRRMDHQKKPYKSYISRNESSRKSGSKNSRGHHPSTRKQVQPRPKSASSAAHKAGHARPW